tara:strand:+ start:25109 stop:25273 length:165 start_codon:yes stop_codon:yes gene_type:complete
MVIKLRKSSPLFIFDRKSGLLLFLYHYEHQTSFGVTVDRELNNDEEYIDAANVE